MKRFRYLVTRQPRRYPRVSLAVRPFFGHSLVWILDGLETESVAYVDPLLVQYIVRIFRTFTTAACLPKNGFLHLNKISVFKYFNYVYFISK